MDSLATAQVPDQIPTQTIFDTIARRSPSAIDCHGDQGQHRFVEGADRYRHRAVLSTMSDRLGGEKNGYWIGQLTMTIPDIGIIVGGPIAGVAWVARPGFIALLTIVVVGWVIVNLVLARQGKAFDPPPFPILQDIGISDRSDLQSFKGTS